MRIEHLAPTLSVAISIIPASSSSSSTLPPFEFLSTFVESHSLAGIEVWSTNPGAAAEGVRLKKEMKWYSLGSVYRYNIVEDFVSCHLLASRIGPSLLSTRVQEAASTTTSPAPTAHLDASRKSSICSLNPMEIPVAMP